jgi:hypothetical protein
MGLCSAPPQGPYIPHNPFIQFWTEWWNPNFLFQMFRNWDPKEIAPLLALIEVGRSVISTISAVRFADVLFTPDWIIPPPLCLLLDSGIPVRTHRTAGCRTFSKCTALFQSLLIPESGVLFFRHFGSGSLKCDWDPRKWDLDQLPYSSPCFPGWVVWTWIRNTNLYYFLLIFMPIKI